MTALTCPIRLAQCGSGLLISNNAMATVVASVFVGLPLCPTTTTTACLIFLTASHPKLLSSSLPSSFFISLRWTAVLQYDAQFGERQLNCCQAPHAVQAICISVSKWTKFAEYALNSFKLGATRNLKTSLKYLTVGTR